MPAGMIDFIQADMNQVLEIYAALSQRTVLRPVTLPAPPVTLKTRGGLTRPEVVYAFATVLALDGICMVDDGTKFVQVVPHVAAGAGKPPCPQTGGGRKAV